MRKLYNEFFYIPKHGKVREKVMLTRVVITMTIIVMCLAAMSITAYAYFSHNVTSGSNTIQAANFETNVSIAITNKNNEAVPINQIDTRTQTATLEKGDTYSVTIEKAGTANTGFCVITASNCEVENYHTQQLGEDANSNNPKDSITFTLTVTNTTVVEFYAHWGTSSYYGYTGYPNNNNDRYILDGETVVIPIIGAIGDDTPSDGSESKDAESTTPSTNTTTGTETPSTQTSESTTTPSTETSTPVATTPPETTGESESTNTTEPSSTTTEPAATAPASTEATAETQPATENSETTGTPTTEASE